MATKRYAKLVTRDLTFVYPSTRLRDGDAGLVVRVLIGQEGDEPHIEFQRPDGSSSPIWDYSRVGYGGPPPQSVSQASAIVKWLKYSGEPISNDKSHMEWPVKLESNGWALAMDPWEKRWHWLCSGGEYRLWVGGQKECYIVTMQTLLL